MQYIQNLNHLSILASKLIVELQNLSFKYIPLHPSCFHLSATKHAYEAATFQNIVVAYAYK
jgi:hypothetical protein